MSSADTITVARGQLRWTVTIDRPDKANALTAEMLDALETAVAGAQSAGAKVLVLTGAGRVFSAGADLDQARNGTLTTHPGWEALSRRIAGFPGLTICALNGTCAGGALGMMLACDLRVAVDGAKVFYPVVKNGFLPQPSDPARLAGLVGTGRAKQILLAGQKIDSRTALDWGLFDQVVPAEGMDAALDALSADAETATPVLLGGIKALFARPLPEREKG